MERLQAYKFELIPTGEQARKMRRFAGVCRFVYNKALALQQERYAAGDKKPGYSGLCEALTGWRNSAQTPWLADAPVHTSQRALKDLERAYMNFFEKRAACPRFKRKGSGDSFQFPDPKQVKLEQGNSSVSAESRLHPLPQQSACARRGAQRHGQPVRREVVCQHPDTARSRRTVADGHQRDRRRCRNRTLRHAERWLAHRPDQELQKAREAPRQVPAAHGAQEEIQP